VTSSSKILENLGGIFMFDFSSIFKELRKKNKKTQLEIAEYLGLTPRAIRYYERGERRPDFDGLIKLADYFNVSLDYLVGRSSNPTRN